MLTSTRHALSVDRGIWLDGLGAAGLGALLGALVATATILGVRWLDHRRAQHDEVARAAEQIQRTSQSAFTAVLTGTLPEARKALDTHALETLVQVGLVATANAALAQLVNDELDRLRRLWAWLDDFDEHGGFIGFDAHGGAHDLGPWRSELAVHKRALGELHSVLGVALTGLRLGRPVDLSGVPAVPVLPVRPTP